MATKKIQEPAAESKLFTPYQLGPITLRNRIIRSAAFENMARANAPTEELQDYHVSVARGGVGMTTVAYCAVDLSAYYPPSSEGGRDQGSRQEVR